MYFIIGIAISITTTTTTTKVRYTILNLVLHSKGTPVPFYVLLIYFFSLFFSCRKVEDLQFRLEEQGVISGDQLETAAENSQQRVKDLEQSLKVEKVQSSKKVLFLWLIQILRTCTYLLLD